jgi:hypothetical protein
MKEYRGHRDRDGTAIVEVVENGNARALSLRLDLFNHSPTGFEWGYGGSGPAQLALAILADLTGDGALAVRLHQKFKWRQIARLPRAFWSISEREVRDYVRDTEKPA